MPRSEINPVLDIHPFCETFDQMRNRLAQTQGEFSDRRVREVKGLADNKSRRQGFPLTEKQTLFYGTWLREIRNGGSDV